MSEPVTFLATFPPIQSAIKIGADSMRIQLDVPKSELANAVELLALQDRVLRITVEPEKQEREERQGQTINVDTINRTKAKRRKSESGTGVQ